MEKEEVSKIILSRPAVEAGEKLGFLPGDLKDKVDPYLRPLYDALEDVLPIKKLEKYMEIGIIEIAPLAFMRGRTLSNSYIILDEAQNTNKMQMKMFLTRLGFNSRMVITGDITQIDLPNNIISGLSEALKITSLINDKVSQIYFSEKDVVRHPLVQKIVNAYERSEKLLIDDKNIIINFDVVNEDWGKLKAYGMAYEAIKITLNKCDKLSSEITIRLTDEKEMRTLNRKWRNKDSSTNVLAFPLNNNINIVNKSEYIGDVVLSYNDIKSEAIDRNITFIDHMIHILIHGVLHLCGYDHLKKKDEFIMINNEKLILDKVGIKDPYISYN